MNSVKNTIENITQSTIPISVFDNGMAEEVFDEVRRSGTKVVMKNDYAECILMSPEDYVKMSDEYNDFKLLTLALERLKNYDPSKLISEEEFDRMFGITEEDLEGYEDVELDLE